MVAALPILPLEAKTSGVKEALYFSDPLLVCSALFLLVLVVNGCHPLGPVGWGAGVKNPYVKKCLWSYYTYTTPKEAIYNIQLCADS